MPLGENGRAHVAFKDSDDAADAAFAFEARERGGWGKWWLWWTVRLAGAGEIAFRVLSVIVAYSDSTTGDAFPAIERSRHTLGSKRGSSNVRLRRLRIAAS